MLGMNGTRLELEVMEMKKRFPNFKALKLPGGMIGFQGTLRPRSSSYEVIAILLPTYPYEAPRVFPVSPQIVSPKHQYKNGALCYHLSHEWSPQYTVCVAIGWVSHWLAAYEEFVKAGYWPGKEAE